MKISGVHWGIFALVMIAAVMAGTILAENFVAKQYQKKLSAAAAPTE